MGTSVTKSQHVTKQGTKISNKWENASIKSKKIHKSTRHTRVSSCKILGHLDVRKHGNENHEVGHQWCDTNCHTLIQKFITHNPDKINSQTLHQNHHECV